MACFDVYAEGSVGWRLHLLPAVKRRAGRAAGADVVHGGVIPSVPVRSTRHADWSAPVRVDVGLPPARRANVGMEPRVAAAGNTVLAVWSSEGTGFMKSGPLTVARVDSTAGRTLDGRREPRRRRLHRRPRLHRRRRPTAAGRFHLVWLDGRGGRQGLRYARSDRRRRDVVEECDAGRRDLRVLLEPDRRLADRQPVAGGPVSRQGACATCGWSAPTDGGATWGGRDDGRRLRLGVRRLPPHRRRAGDVRHGGDRAAGGSRRPCGPGKSEHVRRLPQRQQRRPPRRPVERGNAGRHVEGESSGLGRNARRAAAAVVWDWVQGEHGPTVWGRHCRQAGRRHRSIARKLSFEEDAEYPRVVATPSGFRPFRVETESGGKGFMKPPKWVMASPPPRPPRPKRVRRLERWFAANARNREFCRQFIQPVTAMQTNTINLAAAETDEDAQAEALRGRRRI